MASRIGHLFLAGNEPAKSAAAGRAPNTVRCPGELLAAEDLSARWPILDQLGFAGSSWCPVDHVDQHRAVHGFARAAVAAGATIECGVEVIGFDLEADGIGAVLTTKGTFRPDIVVNCAGAWAPHLAERLGLELPIRSRRVQLLHAYPSVPLPPDLPWLIGPLGQVHVRHDSVGRVQVGGFLGADETVDPLAFDQDADPSWITRVLDQTRETFRYRNRTIIRHQELGRASIRAHPTSTRSSICTEAGMIIVGGFAGLGLMHAPAAGLLAAELILDGEIRSVDPADVSLARLSGPIESIERTGF